MRLTSDTLLSLRMLSRQPGSALAATVALALGIGLTTLMFSIIEGVFLRGLPYAEADRIASVSAIDTHQAGSRKLPVSQADFAAWSGAQRSFETFGAFYAGTANISDERGPAERVGGQFTTAGALSVTGVQPVLGRTLQIDDERPDAPAVTVIGYELWQRRYAGDPAILGRSIHLNGQPVTIVGVMPRGFAFPLSGQLWAPLVIDPRRTLATPPPAVTPVGLLKKGVTIDAAAAEFGGLAGRMADELPVTRGRMTATVTSFVDRFMEREIVGLLWTMLGAVFGVLLIACANVANLLIARTATRTREIAIRTALGASRSRIVAQLLNESAMLAAAGAAGGLGLAYGGIVLFNRVLVLTDPPFWVDVRLDATVLLFVAALVIITTAAAGLIPALRASRPDVNDVLKDESRGSAGLRVGRLSRGLVIAEVALSCGLLVASGLATKSILNLRTIDFGFPADSILTARLALDATYPTPESRAQFYAALDERLNALPGVERATIAQTLPATRTAYTQVVIEGAPDGGGDDSSVVAMSAITPDFFETFERSVVIGRPFEASDTMTARPVAIVNADFAAMWPAGVDPVGTRFRLADQAPDRWLTVVGVGPDLKMGDVRSGHVPGFYTPVAQDPPAAIRIAVRAAGPAMAAAADIRRAVRSLDPDLPLFDIGSLVSVVEATLWYYRVFGSLFAAFGVASLFLATVGLYGVMASSVSARTREISIRMALGARTQQIVGLVLRQGLSHVALGIAIGVVLAAGLSQLVTMLMFGVEPWDGQVFGVVIVTLGAAALLATLVPARRAIRVQASSAFRE